MAYGTVAGNGNDMQIYCGYVVDPTDPANNLDTLSNVSLETCVNNCDADTACTGVSYIVDSTTCYKHGGDSQAPSQRDGWDGAAKVAAQGATTTTTTITGTTSATTADLSAISSSSSLAAALASKASASSSRDAGKSLALPTPDRLWC